jgi:hypothetical protein
MIRCLVVYFVIFLLKVQVGVVGDGVGGGDDGDVGEVGDEGGGWHYPRCWISVVLASPCKQFQQRVEG